MTLDQWLLEATGSFPVGVQKRLAQEYRAHLAESVAAGGSGDVVGLFGKPKTVCRQLEKSYITRGRLFNLNYLGNKLFWIGSFIYGTLLGSLLTLSPSQLDYVCIGIGLISWSAVWSLTRHWQALRRDALRTNAVVYIYFISTISMTWTSNFMGELFVFYLIAAGIFTTLEVFNQDARLRRTLELEAQS